MARSARLQAKRKSVDSKRESEGVAFTAYLQAMASQIRKARSGEKTRLRLMAEGALLLDTTDHRELNVEEVCKAADAAKGTFYIHFQSKDLFLAELARRYVAFEIATVPSHNPGLTRYAQIKAFNGWYEAMFALNAGVLRCLVQMAPASAPMRDLWHERNSRLVDRQMERIAPPPHTVDSRLARLAVRTIGGMIDDSLFERYNIQVGPGREQPADVDTVNELHAVLMYRALYGHNPDPAEVFATRALLDWTSDDG